MKKWKLLLCQKDEVQFVGFFPIQMVKSSLQMPFATSYESILKPCISVPRSHVPDRVQYTGSLQFGMCQRCQAKCALVQTRISLSRVLHVGLCPECSMQGSVSRDFVFCLPKMRLYMLCMAIVSLDSVCLLDAGLRNIKHSIAPFLLANFPAS